MRYYGIYNLIDEEIFPHGDKNKSLKDFKKDF